VRSAHPEYLLELLKFESLPIPEQVLQGIRDAKFDTCTPIQSKSLPITLGGKDLAGQAQTGTGKTAAFLITLLTRLLENTAPLDPNGKDGPRALIIAPTRELARQIEKDALLWASIARSKRFVLSEGWITKNKKARSRPEWISLSPHRDG